ncbi:hypothetical protein COT72_01025 [archaeon CG10_big_fil_rev_8_21_14_0_10_43_11]|nr:MAG: hypothetical protein COT72_01025 [archaeon CG10_big_fil_rev_8_21_14_0_10_43_11]
MNLISNLTFSIFNVLQERALVSAQEKNIGMRPVLNYAPKPMLANFVKTPLFHPQEMIHKKYGKDVLHQDWMNYFSFGTYEKITKPLTRFDRSNPYYQVWSGCYMIKSRSQKAYGFDGDTPVFEDLVMIPEADQSTWINALTGIKQPLFDVYNVTELNKSLHEKSLANYFFKIDTNSDVVVSENSEWYWRLLLSGKKTQTPHPKRVTLSTIMTVFKKDNVLIMPYGCSIEEQWDAVGTELKKMMKSISLEAVVEKPSLLPWNYLSNALLRKSGVA